MFFEMSDKEQEEIDKAVEIARKAEVAIIYVGDDFRTIGESRSRVNLDLSGRQKELVRAVQATGTTARTVRSTAVPPPQLGECERACHRRSLVSGRILRTGGSPKCCSATITPAASCRPPSRSRSARSPGLSRSNPMPTVKALPCRRRTLSFRLRTELHHLRTERPPTGANPYCRRRHAGRHLPGEKHRNSERR